MKTQHVGSLCPAFLPFTTDATLPSKKKQLEYLDVQTTASLCTSFYEPCMLETEVSSHVLDTAICARPNENLQTYKVAFVRIKEACKKLAIKILSLHARMQNTFWMAISSILVPGSKPENLKSRTKSHGLVWTVSVWPFPLCTSHCFPSPRAFFGFYSILFVPCTNEIPVSASVRTEPMYWRALIMPVLHGYWDCLVDQMFRPLYLTLPCREPLDLVSSGHFKISRQ